MNETTARGAGGQRGAPTMVALTAAGIPQLVVGFFTVPAISLVGIPIWGIALLTVAWLHLALITQ